MQANDREHGGSAIPVSETAKRVPLRVVVFSGKGGVGKTTVAVNLAAALRDRGMRVGLLDGDITGPNVGQMLGISEGVQISGEKIRPHSVHGISAVTLASMIPDGAAVVWRGPIRSRTLEQLVDDTEWGDLDALVIDLPPGTGDEVLTVSQRIQPHVAVVVSTPQKVALADARRAVDFSRKLKIESIGLVENMSGAVCPTCGGVVDLFGSGTVEDQANELGTMFFGRIPFDPRIPAAGDGGTLVDLLTTDHPTAQAFQALAESVADVAASRERSGRA